MAFLYLVVRRAALSYIRQMSQKEAKEILQITPDPNATLNPYRGVILTEAGLLAALFAYLDMERDEAALSYTRDTLTCCLLAPSIRDWLMLAKRVLTIKLGESIPHSI
ncbi:unnamed protein product [Plutella xylostella]|uniref:(diamondback moth) hypothetical protein n=1 Tax=Plutella xylostella TaxID=51655 RepID=A0A8S4EBA6_PLUXY|nr:unnamed protein product [Plutella xylostella]